MSLLNLYLCLFVYLIHIFFNLPQYHKSRKKLNKNSMSKPAPNVGILSSIPLGERAEKYKKILLV